MNQTSTGWGPSLSVRNFKQLFFLRRHQSFSNLLYDKTLANEQIRQTNKCSLLLKRYSMSSSASTQRHPWYVSSSDLMPFPDMIRSSCELMPPPPSFYPMSRSKSEEKLNLRTQPISHKYRQKSQKAVPFHSQTSQNCFPLSKTKKTLVLSGLPSGNHLTSLDQRNNIDFLRGDDVVTTPRKVKASKFANPIYMRSPDPYEVPLPSLWMSNVKQPYCHYRHRHCTSDTVLVR